MTIFVSIIVVLVVIKTVLVLYAIVSGKHDAGDSGPVSGWGTREG